MVNLNTNYTFCVKHYSQCTIFGVEIIKHFALFFQEIYAGDKKITRPPVALVVPNINSATSIFWWGTQKKFFFNIQKSDKISKYISALSWTSRCDTMFSTNRCLLLGCQVILDVKSSPDLLRTFSNDRVRHDLACGDHQLLHVQEVPRLQQLNNHSQLHLGE